LFEALDTLPLTFFNETFLLPLKQPIKPTQ
jgi:hypothetical protein